MTLPAETTVCTTGCGPAGAMLGLMLARAGVDVVVLEKHADFFRDFRGDTIHASTLQVLAELDLFEEFDELPHPNEWHFRPIGCNESATRSDSGGQVFGDVPSAAVAATP